MAKKKIIKDASGRDRVFYTCPDCGKDKRGASYYKNTKRHYGLDVRCKKCARKKNTLYQREKNGWKKRRKKTKRYEIMKQKDPEKYALIQQEKQEKLLDTLKEEGLLISRNIKPSTYALNKPAEIAREMEIYFQTTSVADNLEDLERKNARKPTLNGLANALGVNVNTMKNYVDRDFGSDPTMNTVKKLIETGLQIIAQSAEEHLYSQFSGGAIKHLQSIQPDIFKDKEDTGDTVINLFSEERKDSILGYLQRKKAIEAHSVQDAEAVED